MVRRQHLAATLASLALFWGACDRRDDLDGRRRKLVSGNQTAPQDAPTAASDQMVFSVVDNRASLVTVTGQQLSISAGGGGLVPYIDGNLRREWILSADVAGVHAAKIQGRVCNVFVPLDDGPGGVLAAPRATIPVALRLYSMAPKQVASVFVNEQRVADISMPGSEWVTKTISVPRELLRNGENRVRLFFRHTVKDGEISSPAALAWLSVGGIRAIGRPALEGSSTAEPRRVGLVATKNTRLSSFTWIPRRGPRFRAEVVGAGKATVNVALPSGRVRELWSGQASAAGTAIEVDLVELGGSAVRLDMLGSGDLTWVEPRVVAPAAAQEQAIAHGSIDHIILWSVSSLRSDRIGDKTDAFSRFRRTSLSFDSAWSPAPSPALAHSAVITGRVRRGSIAPSVASLGRLLRGAGFATALVSGNGFVNDTRGFAHGFDVYQNPMRLRRPHSARVLWQLARRFLLTRRSGKSFLYIATSEPHLPYTPSQQSLELEWGSRLPPLVPAKTAGLAETTAAGLAKLTGEQKNFIRALYDAEVRDADKAFATMLDDLRELEVADRTAVILFGDHGEELFERGSFGHGGSLIDEAVRVPLLVRIPGGQPGVRHQSVVLADLFPTVLELAGVRPPPSAGKSLLGPASESDRPLVFRTSSGIWSLRHGGFKLTVSRDKGRIELAKVGADSVAAHDLPVVERYLRASLSYAVAFDDVWLDARWGSVANHGPAFAADQGL